MTDIHTEEVRSYNMSRIRSRNTKPEMIVRRFLHKYGFRYRLHPKNLPGKPDITLPKYNTVIFVHGCFWHAHANCKYFSMPVSRPEYWQPKLENNVRKDKEVKKQLAKKGWRVIVIWECQLKSGKATRTLANLAFKINRRKIILKDYKGLKIYHR